MEETSDCAIFGCCLHLGREAFDGADIAADRGNMTRGHNVASDGNLQSRRQESQEHRHIGRKTRDPYPDI
ncbi:MAG: hypothetical protein ABFE13_25640 [Phycisphaerales bacterium]